MTPQLTLCHRKTAMRCSRYFAEARDATAAANLVEVLDAGHAGLEKLYEVTDPADLLTVINLTSRERPNLVAETLFAAVVVHRGWTGWEPAAISELREQWIWHVHESHSGGSRPRRMEA